MSQSPQTNVVAHWSKLLEGFETSATEFYESVEQALARRKIPGLNTSRVTWSEGGLLTPDRTYLRITGSRHIFDICAAPFGTGYFFSSWVTQRKARFVMLQLLMFSGFNYMLWWVLQHGLEWLWQFSNDFQSLFSPFRLVLSPFVLVPVSTLVVLWLIAMIARGGGVEPEAAILTVPGLGWFYARLFAPETYYRIDTVLMFQSSVQAAMLEAIDGLTALKGVRALSEDERKPVFHRLM